MNDPWSVAVAKTVLEMTSVQSPTVWRDALTARVRHVQNRTQGRKPHERIRTAVKLLSDQGWISSVGAEAARLVVVHDREALKGWVDAGAPKLERTPLTAEQGRSCRQKIAHQSLQEAQNHAGRIGGEVYQCHYGPHYHVTSG